MKGIEGIDYRWVDSLQGFVPKHAIVQMKQYEPESTVVARKENKPKRVKIRASIVEYMQRHQGWVASADMARSIGVTGIQISAALSAMKDADMVKNNGKRTTKARWKLRR